MASHQQLRQSMKLTVPVKSGSMTRTVKDEERTPEIPTKGGAALRSIILAPVTVSVKKKKTKRKQKFVPTRPPERFHQKLTGASTFGQNIPLSRNPGQTLWNSPSISVQMPGIRIAAPVTVPMNTQRNDKEEKKKSAESKRHGRQ